jgi:hypothetical protein
VVEDNLSSYTEETAEGYLKPLQKGFGQTLNSNFSTTADIPEDKFYVKFHVLGMAVHFKESDKTFEATTGDGFEPPQQVEASTIVGPGGATIVDGQGGTQYVFPGGFDLESLSFGVPQLTVGGLAGTEFVFRWMLIPTDNEDFENVDFFGIGLRHNLSQYSEQVDREAEVAADFYYQEVGAGIIDIDTWSIGVSTSRRFGILQSYARLGYDSTGMKVTYTDDDEEEVLVNASRESTLHLSASVALNLGVVEAGINGDYAGRVGVGFAIGVKFGRAP